MRERLCSSAAMAFVFALLSVCPFVHGVSVIPSEPAYVRSLDGTWRFKLEQQGYKPERGSIGGPPQKIVLPTNFEAFEKPDYHEDASWKDLGVPGNWEMAGFSPATFNQPDNAIGLYRLMVDIPAEWSGRIVKLNFDGVQNGAEIYLNGEPVDVDEPSEGRANFHQGGNDAFQADLTPHVYFGQKNLLAVRVFKNTKEVDLDTGDFFFLGGIHRSVTLFSVPKTHADELQIRTKILSGDKAELRVRVVIASPNQTQFSMQLEGRPFVVSTVGADGQVEIVQVLRHPKLWSAEHPNLYDLTVVLRDASGEPLQRLTQRVGIREVSIQDGILLINHVPVKFTGMCRHELYPTLGSAINEEVWRKDITMMKAANVNAIRTSHYPYGSKFYDLCDELGMYVMDEMSAGWVPTDTKELSAAFAQHARELVRRDRNHPSVVIWAVGNENKAGVNNKIAADEMRKLDDTRPRLVSWRKAEESDVELDDLHYTNPSQIAKLNADVERRKKYPITFLENPNDWEARNGADYGCLDLWVHVIDRTWQEVWKDNHVPGSFLWEWQDRAVADQSPIKLYDYFPRSGINLVKVKGQCDGFRNPRPDLYHVKMAYAPVKVDLTPVISRDSVTVHAINRYSFTDLAELKTTWRAMKGDTELKSATVKVALPPRSRGDLTFNIPASVIATADTLRLEFNRNDANNVVTYELRLKPQPPSTLKLDTSNLDRVLFPHINLVPVTYGKNAIGWHWAFRHPAQLVHISVNSAAVQDDKTLYAMPISKVASMDADLVLSDAPSEVVGHVHTELNAGRFSYQLKWSKPNGPKNTPTDIQELGWTFSMPSSADHFSWHRQAYWSWYPPTHIGRPQGTATPDSADVDISKVSRLDAFDFNSSKYDCDWAMLASAKGEGLGVQFSPDQRYACRGGIDAGGRYQLVVNQHCAPPRDLSSGVVPDLYFTLSQGAEASGSFMLGTTEPHR